MALCRLSVRQHFQMASLKPLDRFKPKFVYSSYGMGKKSLFVKSWSSIVSLLLWLKSNNCSMRKSADKTNLYSNTGLVTLEINYVSMVFIYKHDITFFE